jgi:hypothetical protein
VTGLTKVGKWLVSITIVAGYSGCAFAGEHLVLIDTIGVNSPVGLGTFDISFVDASRGLYVLADRTNASVDFFNSRDDTFMGRVGGFAGAKATSSVSGPNGVTIVGDKEVWASDGDSSVKVIDTATFKVVDRISTGGRFRCDEMAWDSADHVLAVANNADTPPFVTLINTDTHKILKKIVFDGTNGTPDATKTGIEQSQWSSRTDLFYVSVPQIFPADPTRGGISVIDPSSMSVRATFPVRNCSPAGLAVGPTDEAVIGCSASFGGRPNVLTQSLVINIKTGSVDATIPQVGGSDEVWYDPATTHYYLAARRDTDTNGKTTPVLGTIDARTNLFDGNVPTSTSAHSVAADPVSHHISSYRSAR